MINFKNGNFVKILGVAATAIGIGATLVSDWVSDLRMDEKIEEKVRAALAAENGKES